MGRGKHVAPRPEGSFGNRRLGRLSVVLAVAMIAALSASVAVAHHQDPTLTFSNNPTAVNEEVTITAISQQLVSGVLVDRDASIEQCLLDGAPMPAVVCDGSSTEPATGTWADVGEGDRPAVFDYTPSVAGLHGFRAVGHQAFHTLDLEVLPVTSGDRHNGCNGLENALTKVKPGSKAAEKLMELAESSKFNCD